jgi:hypothetical protein
MLQQHGLGFARRPDHRFHRVPAQLLQRLDALIAIDHQVTIRLPGHRHHYDGNLLTVGGQRRQQSLLPIGAARPPVLPAAIELVKLQLHGLLACRDSVCGRRELVFCDRRGECIGNLRGIKQMRRELVFCTVEQ